MTDILTSSDVVTKIRALLYADPVYIWGANGEVITPEMIQKLKDRFVSDKHTPEYYDEKLNNYRGKKAVDDVGMLNFLSGENLSVHEYIQKSSRVVPAVDINQNGVWVLCGVKRDGTPMVGIYLGNGNVVVTSEGPGIRECIPDLTNPTKWNIGFIPHFLDTSNISGNTISSITEHYQQWLNTYASSCSAGTVPVTGYYDERTKTLSCMIAKKLYGKLVGTEFDNTAEITIHEVVSEVGHRIKPGYRVEDYEMLMYVISMRLYVLKTFPEFIEVWGNSAVEFMTEDFGIRLTAMHRAINEYVFHCRYLDSTEINLPLIRELFL